MPILIVILIVLGGGTSFAAQNTLPGDALYPFKTHVNEEVRSWTALSAEAKAQWEATLASRRLDEAENLATKGELDSEVRAQIEAKFKAHSDKVEAKIKELSEKDSGAAAEAASNLMTSLQVHERILLNISTAETGDDAREVNLLNSTVKAEVKDTAEAQAAAEAKLVGSPDVQTAAEGRMKASENKIAEVKKFIAAKGTDIDATATAQANARVSAADDLMVQGKAKLNAKAYAEAFVLFGKAHTTAQGAKLLLIAKDHFERTSTPKASVEGSTEVEVDDNSARSSDHIRINLGW